MILDYFDVRKYLDSRRIHYQTSGKNISPGWIGMNCLFCVDPSNHLGVNLSLNKINCWLCNTSSTVIKLIMKVDNCNYKKAKEIIQQFSSRSVLIDDKDQNLPTHTVDIPGERKLHNQHQEYLENRNFDSNYIFEKYKLRCCGPTGKYKLRIIIPYITNRRIVTYSARDITNLAFSKYLLCPNSLSIIPAHSCLYNIDNSKDTVVVVEGVTDVWRIGKGCVSITGIKYTPRQVNLLNQFKRVFILLDKGAEDMANRLAAQLVSVYHTEIITLNDGDPADLTGKDVVSLRKIIFGKIY